MRYMQTLETLQHHRSKLKSGGQVVVIDPGAILNAEATAMLQALHSRSTEGIDGHLKILAERGAEKFMSTYYVGYGHKSIGDCGTAVVFIEGISMLAAKAIQGSRLYNGQETSTRYIDFANQPFCDPVATTASKAVLENWRTFYTETTPLLIADLKKRYPKQGEESEIIYDKAIAARAFDIMRGYLPAGASTNVAWSTTLRQFADHTQQLRHHPLAEVREIAETLEAALIATHPNSFSDKRYPETEFYTKLINDSYYYHDKFSPEFALMRDGIDHTRLKLHQELLQRRPAKTELPQWLGAYGEFVFAFTLDFGSFRDLQRHRAITQRMPLLSNDLGFHDWYLDELPTELQEKASALLKSQNKDIALLHTTPEITQYYIPMGYKTSNYLSGDLPALVYLTELRSTRFVHPTLRKRAKQIAASIQDSLSDIGIAFHFDADPDRFDIKRGEHDIVKKAD